MQFKEIKTDHVFYDQVEQLMTDAFPPEERRAADAQRAVTDGQELFHLHVLEVAGDGDAEPQFAGMITSWQSPSFRYVEHFATKPSLRGRGLGREAMMSWCALQPDLPVVLEVEYPDNEMARRRIGFYERCGFRLWTGRRYIQPPYQQGLSPLPLHLMVWGDLDESRDFDFIKEWLYSRVYACDPKREFSV